MRCCIVSGLLLLLASTMAVFASDFSRVAQVKNNIVLPATGVKQLISSQHMDEIIFFEDWESGLNGWESIDLTATLGTWHIDDWYAFGGSGMSWLMADTALYCDTVGYLDNWYMVLDSPPIELPAETCSLTFWHRIGCELPVVSPPYDAWDGGNLRISTDGGTNWTIITNAYLNPPYDANSLYGFGFSHGEGPGVPGWCGQHFDWFLQTVNLTPWAGQTVMLRWAFASDVIWCTCYSSSNHWAFGWQVDNIRVYSGSDTFFTNNGDDDSGWHQGLGLPPAGDLWRIADEVLYPPSPPPSGTHYLACNDSITLSYNDNMENEIVSPYIDLRGLELGTVTVDFMVSGHLGSNPNDFPDCDFWHWEVSADSGATWCYASNPYCEGYPSYVHPDAPTSWMWYDDAYSAGFDISDYVGSVVRIKAVMETNDDGLGGVGPCFDDITITYSSGYPNDFSCYTLQLRFPTNETRPAYGTAYLSNEGNLAPPGPVSAWWKVEGGSMHRLMPNLDLDPDETDTRNFTWTPSVAGDATISAWTAFTIDDNLANDTSYCTGIEVRGETADLELGYDNRTTQYRFNYETGQGAMVKFTPSEDGLQLPFLLNVIRMQFDAAQLGPQDIGLRIFEDDGGALGEEIFGKIITVIPPSEVYPNWKDVMLNSSRSPLCLNGDFWVWLEVLNPDPTERFPQILGDDAESWENHEHFYTYINGDSPQAQPYFYSIRALVTEGIDCTNLGYVTLLSPGPPNWAYRLHHVSGALSRVTFTDFCDGTIGSVGGTAAAGWTAANYADSIVFTTSTPLTSGAIDTFWLSHPWCSDVVDWTVGDSSGSVEGPLPVEMTTFQAITGDGRVTLHWRTESELNNDHFVLYKRRTGEDGFYTLTEIPGHGTTAEPHDY
ncbi:hypothetical protein KKG05_04215, partial [bacterium]|nr:hypothetical protein [bacterium]